ncbi:hypothetical protein RQP53_18375 [Paucibacter sp. APW11]|uniref:PilN domain-containing protein n=1 Tax=Roseateles aquae TaxID=3077235 RepID=A0ABU3PF89_9BURK|nr:hypothetical protein [Paucibacter sp. APW11]MDT9001251.1 hypothetical protein [Paucibacter sp. APW11]
MLRPPAEQEGLRLIACLDGVEGQHWRDEQLVASRWWPRSPDAKLWKQFERDCGVVEGGVTVPMIEQIPLSDDPWATLVSAQSDDGQVQGIEPTVYLVLGLLGSLATVYFGLAEYQLTTAIQSRQSQLAAIERAAKPVFEAREAAVKSAARIQAIDSLSPYPGPLVLMAAIVEALGDVPAEAREWELDGERLRVVLNFPAATLAASTLVDLLEKSGYFADVQGLAMAEPKQLGLVMRVLPLRSGAQTDTLEQQGGVNAAAH